MLSGARTHVDEVVGLAHRLFVVLDDDHGVAEIAQLPQRREETRVVALVESDRRLVEDVEHAHQAGSDLRRQSNALRLAARERLRRAAEREIVEADVDEEAQPLAHFLEDRPRDVLVETRTTVLAHGHAIEELERFGDRELGDLADVQPVHRHRERLRLEPAAVTDGARRLDHELLELLAHAVGRRLVVAALHVREHPFPRAFEVAARASRVDAELGLLPRRAVENERLRFRREISPRRIEIELELLRQRRENRLAQMPARLSPRENDALENRDARVAEDELFGDFVLHAEAAAAGAGAEGRVEGELARLELGEREPARRTAVALGEELRGAGVVAHDVDDSIGEAQRGLERIC